MKREHKSESYIDWLKSLGCVFYAPLIQGDTRDYISGQDLVVSNRGSSPIVLTSAAQYSVECNPSGTYSGSRYRTYYMRNVYIFNRQLSQDEIKQIQQIP